MKKELLSIVKFFGLAIVFLAFSLSVNANKRGFENLADSSKAGYSKFTPAPFKKTGSAYKNRATDFGNALNFDGDNDFVTMGAGLTLPESGWTEEMWVYLPVVSLDARRVRMMMMGGDDMPVWSKRGPFFYIKNNTGLHGGYGYGTGQTQKTYNVIDVLTVNAWNHIAQTYDGNRLKAYVNGALVADVDAPERPNANPIKYLGQGVSDYYYHFKGAMDELRIWNRARTAAEIKDNYTKAVAPNDPDLLLYYSFNQGRAGGDNKGISSVTDNKGKFNGILNNFMLTGASSNFVASLVVIETTANAATNITEGSFTANWQASAGTSVDNYILEVAMDDKFTNLLPAYANLMVPGNKTSWEVTGLSSDFTYYYRVKAVVGGATGLASNVIQAKTQAGFGNALNFDGDNDFVTMGAGLTLPERGWTEEMWIYLPVVSPDVQAKGMMVISGDDMTVLSKRGPFFQIYGNDLQGGYGDGKEQKIYRVGNVLTVNAWNHIAQTYDGNRLKAYVNGKKVADVNAPGTSNAVPIKYLGHGVFNYYYPFKGSMDELRIWNRARSAEEIKDNYTKAVAPNDPDLLLYYSFNQGRAGGDNKGISSVTDNKGKFNGILNNFTLTGASSNFVASLVVVEKTANATTNITEGSFTANWQVPAGTSVDNYILEIAKDAGFTDLLPGYANLMVPGNQTSLAVTGLNPDFTYYYRVKAVVGGVTGPYNNIIPVKTQALSGLGNALNFDGDNDWVGLDIKLPKNEWTKEMWIYLVPPVKDMAVKGNDHYMAVIGNDHVNNPAQNRPYILINNGKDLEGGYGDGGGGRIWRRIYRANNVFTVRAWNHIAQTFDGNRLKAYVNGKKVADVDAPGTSNADPIKYLSNYTTGIVFDKPLNGSVDEFRIWNRARSAEEIRDNYKIPVSKNHPDLLAYYDFNQGVAGGDNTAINTLIDNKGAYNGTLNRFTKTGATSNFVGDLKLTPPVAAVATDITSSSFKAKWAMGAGSSPTPDKYFLDVSTDATFADASKFVTGYRNKDVGNVTEYTVTGLSQGANYYYRLRAGYAEPWLHSSVNSNSITVKTAAIPLVTALDADNVTPVSFNAKWQALAGFAVEKYILEVARDAGFTIKVRAYDNLELGADKTAVEVAGLNPETTYYYRVKAVVGGFTGAAGNVISPKTQALDLGNALNFDGDNDYVSLGRGLTLPPAGWTQEMWVYIPNEAKTGYEMLITGQTEGDASQWAPHFGIYNRTKLTGGFGYGAGAASYDAENVLRRGSWNHLAQSYNGTTRTLTAYVNGNQVASVTSPDAPIVRSIKYFGRRGTNDDSHFKGSIDELRIWGTVRTAEQIKASCTAIITPKNHPDLLLYYDFNQGVAGGDNRAISLVNDNKNAYHGSLNYFSLTGATANFTGSLKLVAPVAGAADNVDLGSFKAKWTAGVNSDPAAVKYFLDISTDNTFTDPDKFVTGYRNKDVGNVTEYMVIGLSPIINYYYRIRAGYADPWYHLSINSNSILAKAAIPAITALDAGNVTPISFNAKWRAPAGFAVEKYILEVARDEGFTNKVRGYDNLELGADKTAVEVAGLNPETTYYYRVKAVVDGVAWAAGNVISPKTQALALGNALNFGVIQFLTIANGGVVFPDNRWTEEMWIKVPSTNPGGGSLKNLLVNDHQSAPVHLRGPSMYFYYNAKLQGGYGDGTTWKGYTTEEVLQPGAWNHVAQTFDGTDLKVYVNGVMVQSFNLPGVSNNHKINYIGNTMPAPMHGFYGDIDELRIWKTARTAEQIKESCKTIITPKNHPDLLLYYDFNQGVAGGDNRTVSLVNDNKNAYHSSFTYFNLTGATINFTGSLKLVAPVAAEATDITGSSFTAKWAMGAGSSPTPDKYFLDVSTDANFAEDKFVEGYRNKDVGNVTEYTVTGLNLGTVYYYRLRASYAEPWHHPSTYSNFITVNAVPTITLLTATNITEDSFTANWLGSSDTKVDYYILEVAKDDKFKNLVSGYANLLVPANKTSCEVTGLSPDFTYYYQVKAGVGGVGGVAGNVMSPKTKALALGNALNFDGDNDYVSLWAIRGLTLPPAGWTQEMWVYIPDEAKTGYEGLTGGETEGDASQWAPHFGISNRTNLKGSFGYGAGAVNYDAEKVLTSGAWNHLAQSYNGTTKTLTAYVNGNQVAAVTSPDAPIAKPIKYFGRGTTAASNFKGSIDELRIWKIARTAEQIRESCKTIITPKDHADLLLYYDFNQGVSGGDNRAISFINDNKNAYYGSLTNFSLTGAASNFTGSLKAVAPVAGAADNVFASSFKAKWAAGLNSDPAANKYFLDVSTDANFADGKFVEGYNNKDVGNVTEYTVTGLSQATDYYYRLRAGYADPWYHLSINSNSRKVRTATVPAVTAFDADNITPVSFNAKWQAPADFAVQKYILEVAVDAGFTNKVRGYDNLELGADKTAVEVSGLNPETTYFYRVKAVVGGFTGAAGNVISPKTQALALGNALNFNGTQYLTIANGGLAFPDNRWTEEMWVYVPSAPETGNGYKMLLANAWQLENSALRGPCMYVVYKTRLHGGYGDGTTWQQYTTTENVLQPGAWNHVAQTFDGTDLKIYVNGVMVESFNLPGTSNNHKINYVGNSHPNGSYGFNGDIDELRIWKTVRTAEQIKESCKTIITPKDHPDLLLYYDFNQGVSGGDNRAISFINDNKNVYYSLLTNFSLNGATANFTGSLKVVAPVAGAADNVFAGSFKAKWAAGLNSDLAANKYFLDVSTDANFADGKFVEGYNNKDVGNVTEYMVTGLSLATDYYYRLRAVYAEPWYHPSVNSNSITVRTAAVPAITALDADNITPVSFNAKWQAPAGLAVEKYILEVARDAGFTNKVRGYENLDVGGNLTAVEVVGLNPETTYYYRVKAVVGGLTGAAGNVISPKTQALALGNALNFNGIDDFVRFGARGITLPPAGWTQEMWVYIPDEAKTGYEGLINGDYAVMEPRFGIYNRTNLQGGYGTGAGAVSYDAENVLRRGAWNHLAQSYNGTTRTLTAYVNGNQVASVTSPDAPVSRMTTYFGVGIYNDTYFKGSIDELRIWGTALSAEQIKASCTAIITPKNHADLLAYYDFNQGVAGEDNQAIRLVNDNKNAYHGSLYYFSLTGATSNFVGSLRLVAPVAGAADNVGFGSFTAKWAAGLNSDLAAVKYFLDVSTDANFADGKFVEGYHNKDVGNVTEFTVTGLSQATDYYYRLRAGYADPWYHPSVNSNAITVRTLTIPAINALDADNITPISFNAKWQALAGFAVEKYILEVAKDEGFANKVRGYDNLELGADKTAVEVAGLNPETTYYYRVKAVVGGATGVAGNVISPKTHALALGNALNFNGKETIFIGNFGLVFPDNQWTEEMWIRLPYINPEGEPCKNLLANTYSSQILDEWRGPSMFIVDNTKLRGGYGDGTTWKGYITENVLQPGAWNHVAQTFDGTDLKVYINGVMLQSFNLPGWSIRNKINCIGKSSSEESHSFYGDIDELRIWGTARTAEQIKASCTTIITPKNHADLLLYYDFNQGVAGGDNSEISLLIDNKRGHNGRFENFTKTGVRSNFVGDLKLPPPVAAEPRAVAYHSFTANWEMEDVWAELPDKYFLDVSTDANFAEGTFVEGYHNKDVGNVTEFTVTGLNRLSTYYYRLRSGFVSSLHPSNNSNTIEVNTTVPTVTALGATNLTEGSFTANWQAPAGTVNKYILEVARDSEFINLVPGYRRLEVEGNQTFWEVTGLSPNVTYYYRVETVVDEAVVDEAVVDEVISAAGNIIDVKTPALTGLGNALNFDGDDDFVTISGEGFTLPESGWTEEMWVYLPYDTKNDFQGLIGGDEMDDWSKRGPFLQILGTFDSAAGLYGGFGSGGYREIYEAEDRLTLGAWNHLAQTYDGSRLKAYVNGALVAEVADPDKPNATPIKYFGQGVSDYYYHFKGSMDELRFWKTARTETEIKNNYKIPVNKNHPDLIAYYDFNQGVAAGNNSAIDILIDNKGAYNGTLNNFTKTGARSNFVGDLKLPPPVAAEATDITGSSFTAKWAIAAGSSPTPNKYFLDVSTDATFAEGTFVESCHNKDVGNVTEFTVTGLNRLSTYYYRLRSESVSWLYPSVNSNTIRVNTVPTVITALEATNITEGSFTANWEKSLDPKVNRYILEVARDDEFTDLVSRYERLEVEGDKTSWEVIGLSPDFTYYYRLRAVVDGLSTAAANVIAVKTQVLTGLGNALNFTRKEIVAFPAGGISLSMVNGGWTEEMWLYISSTSRGGVLLIGELEVHPGPCGCLSVFDEIPSLYTEYSEDEKGDSKIYNTSKKVLQIEAWNHIAQTYDGTELKTYVNGVFVQSLNVLSTTNAIKISRTGACEGNIDELRFWNYARTETEIKDNYKIPVDPASHGLVAYYDFNQGVAAGDNTAINTLIDNKGAYNSMLNNFTKTGEKSNFVGTLKLLPPVAAEATDITRSSFTAKWAMAVGSSPTPDKYFLDVSTDETFAEGKFVSGYHNKEVGNVTEFKVTGLNLADGAYYYRLRAGYAKPWLHLSSNSNTITVNTAELPTVTALAATNPTEGSFTANWKEPLGKKADNYILKVARDAAFTNVLPGYANLLVPGNQTSWEVTGLNPDFTYYYKVKAVVGEVTGPVGNIIQAKTQVLTGLGNALNFTGIGLVVISDEGLAFPNNQWTEEMWIKLPSTTPEGNPYKRLLESQEESNHLRGPNMYVFEHTKLHGGYGDGEDWKNYTTEEVLQPGAWNHVAQTFDGTDLKVYVNGVMVGSFNLPGTSNNHKINCIGNSYTRDGKGFFGDIDELRIWKTARTAEQIKESYKTIITPKDHADLLLYYDFNQGVAGGDNRAIKTLIDNKGAYNGTFKDFFKTGAESNFVGDLKLPPPVPAEATDITGSSFTAKWAIAAGSSPTPNKYFLDVSTDANFAVGTFVEGYQNKDVGNVTEFTVTGLNRLSTYYYRLRAGYAAPWLHPSVNSNKIKVNMVPTVTALEGTNITEGSFTANWENSKDPKDPKADSYILEVARDDKFINLVSRYESLELQRNQTSWEVIGLSPDFTYYYRLRAVVSGLIGAAGKAIAVKTLKINLGNALNFTGNEALTIPNGGISIPDNRWTEEMWLYIPSDFDGEEHHEDLLGNVHQDENSDLGGPNTYICSAKSLHVFYGEGREYHSKNVLQPGAWNHIAQTFDGTTIKVYVNGVWVETFDLIGRSNINEINYIGNNKVFPSSIGFQGNIDEVRIWNYARSKAEIKNHYKTPVDPASPGLIAYYDFNQGMAGSDNTAVNTLIDNKGAYNATLEGFAKTGATSNLVGDLNLTPPVAAEPSAVTYDSFTAGWAMAAGSSPPPDKYFLEVSTDETFADESKFVSGYRNKNVGNVTEYAVTGLNPGTAYYYRLRAGYAAPWLHPSVNSNTIKVKTLQTNNIALAATAVKVYGDAPYQLAVSSSGTGAYTYTITEGDAVSISNTGQVTVLKAGIATLAVTQAADAVYGHGGSVIQTITVQSKGLTVTATAADKEYDGTNAASVTLSVSGTVTGDEVWATAEKATFNNKDVGAGKPVTVTEITLSGAKAGNYVLANTTATSTAAITPTDLITALTLTTNTLYTNSPTGTLAGTLTVSSTDPKAIYTYSLVPEAGDNGKFTIKGDKLYTNAVFNYAAQSTYTVRIQVSSQSGGMLTKDFILTILYVNESPTLDAIPDQSVCATTDSHTINLSGITPGPEANQTTTLSIAGNNKDMFNVLSVTQLSGGKGIINYSLKAGVTRSAVVTVTVKDDGGTANGGADTYSVSFTVNVNPLPAISISTGTGKLRIVRGRTIDLTANAPVATAYSWANAKGIVNDRNTAKLTVKPTEHTVYTVGATSAAGCVDVKQITIEVDDEYSDVVANNIITHNGDGVNDVWVIENIEHYPNATVKVFDRARRLVFSQKGYNNKWNGYFNGKPLQRGTYYYVINFGKGKNLTSKGYITIINEQ